MSKPVDPDLIRAKREIAAVEKALRAGYPPKSLPGNNSSQSAGSRAAAVLGEGRIGFHKRVGAPDAKNGVWARRYNLRPNWLLYVAPAKASVDEIEAHKARNEQRDLLAENKRLRDRLIEAQEYRASILGIQPVPAEPTAKPRPAKLQKHSRQAVVLHLSDLHVGEVVNREEVMGVNEYNLKIAEKRIGRLFNAASILTTSAWPASDSPPVKISVLLGGDLISGHGLHPEHAETDAGTAYQQTKWAAEYIAGGVLQLHLDLAERFGKTVPIELISVVGNHGRDTFGKPRTKLVSLQSYDTLVSDFVEAGLKGYPTIAHYRPRGFDAYFDVVGWPCLVTHGDRMGSGGGTGFIGPMATIVKGHRKIIDTEHRQRRPVYKVFSAHFHTTGVSPFGFANGSGIGYGEFSKSIRADPEPAQQNLVVFHERIGMLRWHLIAMGDPSEGSIYQPTAGLILPSMYEARG
jgi:hypothetical protein